MVPALNCPPTVRRHLHRRLPPHCHIYPPRATPPVLVRFLHVKIYVVSYIDDETSVDIESLQLGLVLAVVILLNTLLDFTQRQNAIKVELWWHSSSGWLLQGPP